MVMITNEPIDPKSAYDLMAKETAGSVLCHFAVVKAQEGDEGVTHGMEFTPVGDVEGELSKIAVEIAALWEIEDILLIRRVGRVDVGGIISLVAVSSSSSEHAFAACKEGIGRLKKMSSVAKREVCG